MDNKPRVQIEKCFVVGNRLFGVTKDHPNPNGLVTNNCGLVKTSEIVKHHSMRCIETRNTIYEILSWEIPEQSLKSSVPEV